MLFQFNKPSISAIRATLLIDKLNSLTQQNISISLCATGRTGSGKTTLGNRLVGIDYFMPSTGQQDCTDEINLVEFPVGLKYFDLPGVCSSDILENYNRAALGIEQRDDCPSIESLTLARYSQGSQNKNIQKQNFPVTTFQQSQLQPDLILYIIAPHQQFLAADCIYLRDLLKPHTQVIFVFNMFINKDTKTVLATDQNIIDATNRIKRVCASVLGTNYQPIITPVNCWTGEGISDLLKNARGLLGSEKGKLLEELIRYQQQNTANEYLRQVKLELLRLFSYTACQKPEDIYTCDQPLHQACQTLWYFLSDLQSKSEQTAYHLGERIDSLISATLSNLTSTENNIQEYNPLEDEYYFLKTAISTIDNEISYLNEKISSCLFQSQQEAREFREREAVRISNEIESNSHTFDLMQQDVQTAIDRYYFLINEIDRLKENIQSSVIKHDELVENYNSRSEEISSRIDKYNSDVNSLNQLVVEISNLENQCEFRMDKVRVRADALYDFLSIMESNPFLQTQIDQATADSLLAESKSVGQEQESINAQKNLIEEKIKTREIKSTQLEWKNTELKELIEKKDEVGEKIERYKSILSDLNEKGLDIFNSLQSTKTLILEKKRDRNEFEKYVEEKLKFYTEVFKVFDTELSNIDVQIDADIKEIKSSLELISLSLLLFEKTESTSIQITSFFQKEVNSCLKKMESFKEAISQFQYSITSCVALMPINILATSEVILQSTINHFDSTGDCAFKGTTYSYFGNKGIALLLTIADSIALNQEIRTNYISQNEDALRYLNELIKFPANPIESDIFRLLESKANLLFSPDFDRTIKQVAL